MWMTPGDRWQSTFLCTGAFRVQDPSGGRGDDTVRRSPQTAPRSNHTAHALLSLWSCTLGSAFCSYFRSVTDTHPCLPCHEMHHWPSSILASGHILFPCLLTTYCAPSTLQTHNALFPIPLCPEITQGSEPHPQSVTLGLETSSVWKEVMPRTVFMLYFHDENQSDLLQPQRPCLCKIK